MRLQVFWHTATVFCTNPFQKQIYWVGHKTKPTLATVLSELHVREGWFVGLGGNTIVASIAYIYGKCPASHPNTADKDGFWPVCILCNGGTAHLSEEQPIVIQGLSLCRTHFGQYCDCAIFGKLEPAQFMLVEYV